MTTDRERLTEARALLNDLYGHWSAYSRPEWGDAMHAYYCLAKGAAPTWRRVGAFLAHDDEVPNDKG